MDALNNLRNCDSSQQQVTVTTAPTGSTILSGVGMSGGSITYTNLGMLNLLLCCNTSHKSIIYPHCFKF